MTKGRVEAFSDGVLAIIITVMVLEFKAPASANLLALRELWPEFVSYLISFVFIGIYWNNHHHFLHAAKHVNGRVLWANLLLLFWLSLIPFGTLWLGRTEFAQGPVTLYAVLLLGCAVSFSVLTAALVQANGHDSEFRHRLGSDSKGKISLVIYLVAIATSFFVPLAAIAMHVCVAILWFIPDKRFEHQSRDSNADRSP